MCLLLIYTFPHFQPSTFSSSLRMRGTNIHFDSKMNLLKSSGQRSRSMQLHIRPILVKVISYECLEEISLRLGLMDELIRIWL